MVEREACPQCGSSQYKRNGRIHSGKQNHKCKACGRAFVLIPEHHVITEEHQALIERLLLERISLRGICRAVGVGLRQQFPVIELERLRAYRQEPGEKDGQTVSPTAGAQEREHRCA